MYPSLLVIFLEQNQDCALITSLTPLPSESGTKSLRLADNIDPIAESKAKLTDLTTRLTYQHIYFAWRYALKRTRTWLVVTTRKGTPCTGDTIGGKTLDEMNNFQYII